LNLPTLREVVAAPGAAVTAEIRGLERSVAVADVLSTSFIRGDAASLQGRSVALATDGQLATAVGLLELDGVARRMVLCTPDLAGADFAAVMAAAGTDVVLVDEPAGTARAGAARAAADHDRLVAGLEYRQIGSEAAPSGARDFVSRSTEWVLLTSGTTAVPKLVAHDLQSLAGRLPHRAVDGDRIVWSTFYDIRRYGGLQIFLRAMTCGAVLVLSDARETIGDFLARAGAQGVTHISGTPSHWRRALMSGAIDRLRPRYVRLSGEVADQSLLDALRSAFPSARIAHAFASTEAGVAFDVEDGLAGFPAAYVHGGAAERPGGVELAVIDGTLRIRSARNAACYLGAAPPLAGADGFVDTGDLVELTGGRYQFRGRRGGVINVGGQKVYPEEVEAALNADSRVKMSLVRARRNPITGAVVVADVVLAGEGARGCDPEVERLLIEDLRAGLRRTLPAHKVPAVIRVVATLEVSAGGKLVRPGG
jgi:acyl-coenzyme A synthetase/AMP-(fatty) acid ligase